MAQAGSLIQRISVLTEGMEAARRTQTEQQWFRPTEPKDAPKDAPRPETSIVYMASKPDATLVGGQRYLLFSWGPLPGDDPTGGESTVGDALWLVGFAQEIPYLANVHRIPYAGLITSLVILLLLLFSWQLLKIRWLAPQERLHGADVRILGLSVLGLVGAMTILLLAYATHTIRELRQDEELKKLADTVAGRLRAELVDGLRPTIGAAHRRVVHRRWMSVRDPAGSHGPTREERLAPRPRRLSAVLVRTPDGGTTHARGTAHGHQGIVRRPPVLQRRAGGANVADQ